MMLDTEPREMAGMFRIGVPNLSFYLHLLNLMV